MNSTNQTLIPNLQVLEFTGAETVNFLQGQLSCDVEKLAINDWTWGGYLSLKGRLLTSFILTKVSSEEVLLIMEKELTKPVLNKLNMYRLRAKTTGKLADLHVVASTKASENALKIADNLYLRLTQDEVSPDESLINEIYLNFVNLGAPWLTATLFEELTAHNISLDLAHGVDLAKGCYLGQEIFIRSHHRGAIKKRAFIITGSGEKPTSGEEILSEKHAGQVAGNFIYGANTDKGFTGLASIRKDAVSDRLELTDGREITAAPPPYGLVDEKFENK